MNESVSFQVKADELFQNRYENECIWVHKFMAWIMFGQWVLGVMLAIFWSPYTWIGEQQDVHLHVWSAILLGGWLSAIAIGWIQFFPREASTRHVVAIVLALWSALLIHLSGGRIETHFHVFISLAILGLYRDWKILLTATFVIAADHFIRGVFYPASVFGVFTDSSYRWVEHSAWVLVEVAFLAPGCYRLRNEVRELCVRQCEIEEAKQNVDRQVELRTRELSIANERLKEATAEAEKLAMVAKYTDNGVLITDENRSIEWVNSGFTRIFGYSAEEAIGKRPSEFLHGPETDQKDIARIEKALNNRLPINTETLRHRKNGDPFWLSLEIRPMWDKDKELVRFLAIQSDVTKRKSMELTLADAEARLRSIINNVPGAFYRKEICDQATERTSFFSNFIENLTGYSAEEFSKESGYCHRDFVHPDDAELLAQKVEHAIQDQSTFHHEYRIIAKDQTIRWVSEKGQCHVVHNGNTPQTIIDGMLFDITARIEAELENQKLHADLLDASRQAGMAEIATGVLHNVGNILNSVNVSASVIQKQFSNSALRNLEKVDGLIAEHESEFDEFVRDDKRGQQVPAYIHRVTGALCDERAKMDEEFDDLVKNIDHIKRIVGVQQSMAKSSRLIQEVDAAELIRDAVSANRSSLTRHDVRLQTTIDASVTKFQSDKHRILQVLINLIKNAKDSLKEQAPADPVVSIDVDADNACIRFRVTDNGTGIERADLAKIFQHGFTTKASGHGYGLHSSANAATEMGGKLSVQSDGPGRGATFELSLPFQTESRPATRSSSISPSQTATVL
ncbi:PAS domain S-box protein [Mariniblastus fucicola]|uniref:histidine kinase n=1 Tax=Mariniblastus fucicola TaxID=980251 RepID=A0A5B9P6I7_9BACT|nr:PAS domain S-box protein [Mariniblastus fucicola]QEG20795.1 Blue-light photoreceptor [Mariniblastus fucicola]